LRSILFKFIAFFAVLSKIEAKCSVSPIGIDDSSGITTSRITSIINGSAFGEPLPYLFLVLVDDYIGSVVETYESPIQFRQAAYHGMNCFNVAAMYHPTALNVWGQGDDHRICTNEFNSTEQKIAHEQVAVAYAFAYGGLKFNPQLTDAMTNIMNNVLKLNMSNILDEEDPPISTPWGLAKSLVDQMAEYAKSDGWNADGSLANNFNKQPFSDFNYGNYTAYSPNYSYDDIDYVKNITKTCKEAEEIKEEDRKKWPWCPLRESKGYGHFIRQAFVVPHIGFTAQLYGLNATEYEKFSLPDPNYDHCTETAAVIERTRIMATDDKQKVEIELFDSKFTSLLPMQVNWSIAKGFSLFDFWYYDVALVSIMYDATVVVWREKVIHDAVRPTTVVHTLKGDEEIESYAGPFSGSQVMKGADWQPYIRTMPHAEYPSGSACVCTSFAETMQILTGTDNTTIPVGMTIKAGSSKSEPNVVPSQDIDIFFDSWSDIQHTCGISRLNGGMHFSKAVPDSEKLCSGIAALVIDRTEMLKAGNPDGAIANLYDTSIVPSSTPSNNIMSSNVPSSLPTLEPSLLPSDSPSELPSDSPSLEPSLLTTTKPSSSSSPVPSNTSGKTSSNPTYSSTNPSAMPTDKHSSTPSFKPSSLSTGVPSFAVSMFPSKIPSLRQTEHPTKATSKIPSLSQTMNPTKKLTTFAPTKSKELICAPENEKAMDCGAKDGKKACCPGLVCHYYQFWRCVKEENMFCAGPNTFSKECGSKWRKATKLCCGSLSCKKRKCVSS